MTPFVREDIYSYWHQPRYDVYFRSRGLAVAVWTGTHWTPHAYTELPLDVVPVAGEDPTWRPSWAVMGRGWLSYCHGT